jgi:hypothetical protein
MKQFILFFVVTSVLLAGCATHSLNAPCNRFATFCGTKTKINT